MTQIRNLEEMPQALNYLISKVESLEEMVNELSIYNPQNEMFNHFQTKRPFSKNEMSS